MELRLKDLRSHLERTLAPVYVVHGEEPLQAIEACDAIRSAARRKGFDEREVLVAEAGLQMGRLRGRQRQPRPLR
jgi:DNA polymerase-3 subunit delta